MATVLETPEPTTVVEDDKAKPIKAIVGAVLAGLTATATALLPDSAGVVSITPVEWVGIAAAVVATGGAVFGVTNPKVAVR